MKTVRLTLLTALLLGAIALSLFPASPAAAQAPGYTLTIAGGDNQSAHVGTAFALPLQVAVADASGTPVAGVEVSFSAAEWWFATSNPKTFTATTGADGVASAPVTANSVAGGPYVVTAAAGGQTVTFHLTNVAFLTIVAGDNQSATPGAAFAVPLQVTVVDDAGNPAAGAVVTFTAPASGPSTSSATFTAMTGADGAASAPATANLLAGAYTVIATASTGGGNAAFHLTNSNVSFWMPDPLDPGQPQPAADTPPDTAWPGWWWRDTTNQNAIAQHSETQFTGQAYQIYASSKLRVLVHVAAKGANTVAIITTNNFLIVGSGGAKMEAMAAKNSLQKNYPPISAKDLLGVIYTGINPEVTWGTEYWRNSFYSNPLAPVYASAGYVEANAARGAVEAAVLAREDAAYGRISRGIDSYNQPTVGQLAWGSDAFLGAGSMKYANGAIAWYGEPSNVISEETTLYSDSIPVTLMPSAAGDGGMLVWLPNQKILIGADLGRYLPDAGSISWASVPVSARLQALDKIRTLQPVTLIPSHGMYVSGNANINGAVDAQYDALQSIYDQTLVRIKAGDTLDEAAAAVALPAELAASPYDQELVSTVPAIVRNIYHEKMGWFGGETHELAATLTPAAKAAALAAALGGADTLIAAARTAELNARDLAAAEKALYLAEAAHEAAPENATARRVYAQALRKNAFMQKSTQVRNYYLYVALHLEQFVTDFARSGDENATLAFSAADFGAHFSGLSGATLEKVQIVTLPPAESGVLKVDGYDCKPGREIAVADLGKLTFTPAPDWNGETSFIWNGASGGNYAAQAASVTITIAPLNDAPAVSSPLADMAVDEDALSATYDLSTVFTDPEGDLLSYTVESSNPALVSATLAGPLLTLDFQAEQHGAATITISAADEAGGAGAGGLWATDDFLVTVNPVNDAPWATGQTESVTAGLARTFTLDYGDIETAKVDLTVTFSGPSVGTLDTSALPSVTYTAPVGYVGPDSFTVTVTDRGDPDGCTAAPCSGALQAQATITLDVSENSIKGRVYNDANANSSQDAGETGVAGVTVRLTAPDGTPVAEQVTGADGAYAFNSLVPGTYQVRQVLLPGYVQTTPNPADIVLELGQALGGVDFGVVYSADLSVTMTADVNDRTIIYTFVVTNAGPAEALDAVLNNIRPHGVAYTTIITTQGVCQGGNTLTCEFGTMPAGGSVTMTVQANRTDKKNAIENAATVTAATFDIALDNNSATATLQ